MKKRLIALFLCSALLFGMFPVAMSVAADADPFAVYCDGQAVTAVELPENGTTAVTAMLDHTASGNVQWQIDVGNETWVDIQGATDFKLTLRYAMVANVLTEDGTTAIRCRFEDVSGEELITEAVTVAMAAPTATALNMDDVEQPDPVILDYGKVEIHATEPAQTQPAPTEPEATTQPTEPEGAEPEVTDPVETEPEDETQTPAIASLENGEPVETESVETEPVETEPVETEPVETEGAETEPQLSFAAFLENFAIKASAAETDNENVKKTYNIVINYRFENNEIVSDPYTASLAEGSSFSATVTFPTVQGYLPYVNDVQKNSMELNYDSINGDVTINVVYKPTNVNYTVIHYQQNVDNDNYTIESTETKQGLTGSQVPEVAKTFEGFYSLLYERPAIAADGSTVIEVYYDRYYYLMNFDMDGGYGTEPIYARYGASIGEVTAPTKAGYTFAGWSETKGGTTAVTLPTSMPAESKTYYAIWEPDSTAKVTVVFWGENADDEGYSYLADYTKEIYLKPGTTIQYDGKNLLTCGVHSHDANCYKLVCTQVPHKHNDCTVQCTHTHTTSCYSVSGYSTSLISTTEPTQTLTDKGNGIYTYRESGILGSTNYFVKIGDQWYCGADFRGSKDSMKEISFNCSHTTHDDACYTCGLTANNHRHTDYTGSCYEMDCDKKTHTHGNSCYTTLAGVTDTTLWKFVKSDSTTVAADGSTVLNVYYDRIEFTLTFKKSNSTVKTIKEKWGADIHSEFPIKDDTNTMWWKVPDGCTSMKSGTTFGSLVTMPAENIIFTYDSYTSAATLHYYVEALNGTEGAKTAQQIYSGFTNSNYSGIDSSKTFISYKDINISTSGWLTYTEEFHDIVGFRQYVSYPKFDKHELGGKTNDIKRDNYLLYVRNNFKIAYFNPTEKLSELTAPYGASLSSSTYNWTPSAEQAPEKYEPGSVEFDGWYLNPECTGEKFDFTTATMPAGPNNVDGEVALSLYAKWVPVTHTVTFYLDQAACEAGTKLDTHPAVTVLHGSLVDPTPEDPTKGSYTFIGWFYMENGVEKAFDFANMQVRKDLAVYGKWSSNTLKQYTVQYVLKSDHSVKVADDLTGSGLAGTTKTFDAKGETELYAAYQEGYFPTVQSQSLLLDIESNSLVITFEYVPMPAVPYTVKYVEKDTDKSLADDKVVSDNRKAVVTETFKPISGYMPDAYQKRLVVTAEGENILYFYYSKDATHAYYKITHYTQNTDGATWTEYASSQAVGDIGTRYTASPMTIPGFTYKEIKYVVNSVEVTDVTTEGAKLTADGLEINLYYVRNEYPYLVRYLEQGSGNVLHDPKNGTGKYGEVVSESAIDIEGYDKVDPTSVTLNIRIDEGEGKPNINIITFYYKEQEVTINYVAVGPKGTTNFGSVTPTTETVKVKSGTVQGSTPTAGDGFKFVGWFKDQACTEAVDASWVTDNKIVPQKTDGKNVAATYYAKFEYDVTSLTIQKTTNKVYSDDEVFIFNITGPDGYSNRVVVPANGSVTINGLKVGSTYTVTEDTSWSWRYDVRCDGATSIELKAESNVLAFTNTLNRNKWLDDNAYAENVFTN